MSQGEMHDTSDVEDEETKESGSESSGHPKGSSSPTNLRSSPPLPETDPTVIEDPPDMNKKRSQEEMNVDYANLFASSATMVGDIASSAVPAKETDQPNNVKPSTVAHNMGPPPPPSSSMPTPFNTAPTSAQIPQKSTPTQPKTSKPPPEQREKASPPKQEDTPESDDAPDVSTDPGDQIADFDWEALLHRYHQKMNDLNQQENDAMNEFHQLCQYFAIWSDAGGNREVDRSYKRLKTQTSYVQHEEDQLEEKRQHYIKVVDAFKSALDLLTQ